MNYELKNKELTVIIASAGAELRRIVDAESGRDYLWNGDSAYWGRVSPVLFPVVGNYFERESIYDGQTYTMGQHGFARDTEFVLSEQTENAIWFRMEDSEETKKKYPFSFRLEVGYELTGRVVKVLWRVKNTDDRTMYFSIGAHPAFLSNLSTDALKFDAEEVTVDYIDLETACLGGEQEQLKLAGGVLAMTTELFDRDALILGANQTKKVTLLDAERKPVVAVDYAAPLVGIWSPAGKNAPFVCIEPWYGRSDRNGFNKKLEEREYGNTLEAGEVFEASYEMTFFG